MTDKKLLTWPGARGTTETRDVNLTINIEDFEGTPGFALLVLAANRHLSVSALGLALKALWGVERGHTWIEKRRWLFANPDTTNKPGIKPNADGKDGRALAIMREHRTLSLSLLVKLLAESGIRRSREWVRLRRCD